MVIILGVGTESKDFIYKNLKKSNRFHFDLIAIIMFSLKMLNYQ